MTTATETKTLGMPELMSSIRGHVRSLLESGAEPSAISFALAFIATELGLCVCPEPVRVFPVLLNAVAQAASERSSADETDTGDEAAPHCTSQGQTLH